MRRNKPVKLEVSSRENFVTPLNLLAVLAVLAAMLSPRPVLMTTLMLLFFCAWIIRTLKTSKTNNNKLILVIFPDGRVRLESNREKSFEGFLDGEQWCSHQLAVLQIADGDISRKLIIQCRHQQAPDDFRRLSMWLRQDFSNNTRAGQVLGS